MPRMKLTGKSVERLGLSVGGYVEYYDPKLTGFGVRVGPKSKVYFVAGRVNGNQFKHTIGKADLWIFDDAYAEALRILKDASQGIRQADREEQKKAVAKERRAETTTVREMFREYRATRKALKKSSSDHYEAKLKCYLSDWLDLPLAGITPDMVVAKHSEIGAKSASQANHVFRIMRALFNHAIEMHEAVFVKNPVDRLSRVGGWYKPTRRKTCLKRSEISVFLKALKRHPGIIADYLHLLLLTGCRPNEIAKLTAGQVFLKDGFVVLDETKTTTNLQLPMSVAALAILKRRIKEAKAEGERYLFWSRRHSAGYLKDVRVSTELILDGTGISICPYDLRRTFLTCADELGVSNVVQKALVGHAVSQDVTDGYKVLTLERLRTETERISGFITSAS